MTTNDLLEALARLRVETGSLACLGCGHEHNCSTHGCQILREAAAQLEHFTAENAALREKVPQWVSVEDAERLPLPGTRVIATDGVFVGEAYRGKSGEWRRYDDCLCWFDVTSQEVTHWMPLPEAPAEGEKEDA